MSDITFDEHGYMTGKFPPECIAECSDQGSVDDAVEYWCNKLNFSPPRALMISYLRDFGAWEDLDRADEETLAHRVLWIACCDMRDNPGEPWLGLVH